MVQEAGVLTAAVLQPVLDEAQSLKLIEAVAEHVDVYALGSLIGYGVPDSYWQSFMKRARPVLLDTGRPYYDDNFEKLGAADSFKNVTKT